MKVGFAEEDGARVSKSPCNFCILAGNVRREHAAGGRRALGFNVNQVLKRHRDAVQRSAIFTLVDFFFDDASLEIGEVVSDGDKRILLKIEMLNPAQALTGKLDGGQLARADGFSRLAERQLMGGGHT
jgi:hypothetical protein